MHPERKELAAYLDGSLSESSADALEGHLQSCPECEATINQLGSQSDTLHAKLRKGPPPSGPAGESDCQKMVGVIQDIGRDPTSPGPAATPAAPHEQELGTLREYKLLKKLGEGGMGAVYRALHTRLDKIVALKVLTGAGTQHPAALARFEREMKAIGKLRHPNIVTAFDAGEANGTHFLVMELIDGADFSALVKKNGPLPVAKALDYIVQAARGLAYAHSRGIIHRDIKPGNLLLDDEGIVKVLDMGLARFEDPASENLTATEQVMGTVDYMAPEQGMSTHAVDARADVYSLGVTLWYLLTGTKMYDGETVVQRVMQHHTAPIPSLIAKRPDVPPALNQFFARMVAKKADERAQSMEEVIAALAPLVEQTRGTAAPSAARESGADPQLPAAASATLNAGQTVVLGGAEDTSPTGVTQASGKPTTSAGRKGPRIPRSVLIGAAAAGFIFVALGAWIIVRDKSGKEVARVAVPEGGKAEFIADGERSPSSSSSPLPAAGEGPGVRGTPLTVTPLDALRREQIDPYELQIAGGGNPANAPAQLVGIFGDSHLAMGSTILGMAMFPDDQTIATVASDNNRNFVNVWDRASGRRKSSATVPGLGCDVAVSPDGTLLACAGNVLKIWEYPSMKEYRNLEGQGVELIRAFRISPDNRWGAAGGANGTLYIWDLKANRLVHSEPGKKSAIASLAFHPTSSVLAVVIDGTLGNDVGLWELPNCKPLPKLSGHTRSATDVAFSPDGKSLYSVGADRTLLRWDWAAGKSQTLVKENPGPGFDALAVHPQGHMIATFDRFGEIAFWEAAGGVKQRSFLTRYLIPGGNSSREHLQFASNGRFLISSHPMLTTVGVWPLAEGETVLAEGHREVLQELAVTPDGKHLVTNSTAGKARIWNLATREVARDFATAIPDRLPKSMALSPDGATLVVGSKGYLRLWNLSDGSDLRSIDVGAGGADGRPIRHVLFSKDGNYLGARHQFVTISDLSTGAMRKLPLEGSSSEGWAMSADGQTAYVKKDGKEISRYRTSDWSFSNDWPSHKIGNEGVPTLSADGELIALNSSRSAVIEAESGKLVVTLPGASHLAAAPAGQRFAGVRLNKYWVWDRASGLQEFEFPEDVILGQPTFSPDGRHLLTSNRNGTVYVLRLSDATSNDAAPLTASFGGPAVRRPWGADDVWIKQVSALPPEQQIEAVSKKLMELNPGFDGKLTDGGGKGPPKIENGAVTGLQLITDNVTDISPLRALAGLKTLGCICGPAIKGALADISPLRGVPLTTLKLDGNLKLSDLSPLQGMKLTDLRFNYTKVSDLSPLTGMPLKILICGSCPNADLSPLKGMQLTELNCSGSKVTDLSPLRGMPLKTFACSLSSLSDVSPLCDCKNLTLVNVGSSKVTPEAVAALQTALPNCKILWDAAKAAGGHSNQPRNAPAFQQWVKDVQALPAEQQIDAVSKKLMELNPGFDGKLIDFDGNNMPKVENGVVTELKMNTENVTDISPLRALSGFLRRLSCAGSIERKGKLSDLSPLAGMSLKILGCDNTRVADLSPLAGMPLERLWCNGTRVSNLAPLRGAKLVSLYLDRTRVADLSPLEGMPLELLSLEWTQVADLAPIAGAPLKSLHCCVNKVASLAPLARMPLEVLDLYGTPVSDLSPLEGMPLRSLNCTYTRVSDLSPLKGMKLTYMACGQTRVSDLSPLAGMPLDTLIIPQMPVSDLSPLKGMKLSMIELSPKDIGRGMELLRGMESLKTIGLAWNDEHLTSEAFWQKYDAGGFGKPMTRMDDPAFQQWMREVADQPADEQVKAVVKKLQELNPAFDGEETHRIEDGVVRELRFLAHHVADIAPVAALTGLKVLWCYGDFHGRGQVYDLSPLKGLQLTELGCSFTRVHDVSPLKGMPLASLNCADSHVWDLAPLEGMQLKSLYCGFGAAVSDLSPVRGMPLEQLYVWGTNTTDLTALRGLKLTYFNCNGTQVEDLSPLAGMPLVDVCCSYTLVSDLSPLKGMKLWHVEIDVTNVADLSPLAASPVLNLSFASTPVSDLSPLGALRLMYVQCGNTQVTDLAPLKGMPIVWLACQANGINDLSPLRGMPLKDLTCNLKAARDAVFLRSIKTLENINDKPAAEFWKEVDAGQVPSATTPLGH